MMGVATWRLWRGGGVRANRAALSLLVVQLAVNACWSWRFFVWHRGARALADIALL